MHGQGVSVIGNARANAATRQGGGGSTQIYSIDAADGDGNAQCGDCRAAVFQDLPRDAIQLGRDAGRGGCGFAERQQENWDSRRRHQPTRDAAVTEFEGVGPALALGAVKLEWPERSLLENREQLRLMLRRDQTGAVGKSVVPGRYQVQALRLNGCDVEFCAAIPPRWTRPQ